MPVLERRLFSLIVVRTTPENILRVAVEIPFPVLRAYGTPSHLSEISDISVSLAAIQLILKQANALRTCSQRVSNRLPRALVDHKNRILEFQESVCGLSVVMSLLTRAS